MKIEPLYYNANILEWCPPQQELKTEENFFNSYKTWRLWNLFLTICREIFPCEILLWHQDHQSPDIQAHNT